MHFHLLWPDGAFSVIPGDLHTPAEFHPVDPPTDADVARLVRAIHGRVLRFLRRHQALPPDGEPAATGDGDEPSLLATLAAASVQGKVALGPHPGAFAARLGRGTAPDSPRSRGKLCADIDGFSLHAAVRVPAFCQERLEKLCRYAARPPLVHDRLSLSDDGTKVIYRLKRRYRDGSTHVVLDPLDFIARLAALVPRPRVHLTTYHGVFAPAASLRDRVVPAPPPDEDHEPDAACAHRERPTAPPPPARRRRRRYSWAELLRRVFWIDVLLCHHCGGTRRLLDFTCDPAVVERILAHLGLPVTAPPLAPARGPPEAALPFA